MFITFFLFRLIHCCGGTPKLAYCYIIFMTYFNAETHIGKIMSNLLIEYLKAIIAAY